jgi:uncharacterized protein
VNICACQHGFGRRRDEKRQAVPLRSQPVVDEFPVLPRSLQRTLASNARLRKGILVAHPVVHFEIIGKNPDKLRDYFGELFGWQFDTSSPLAEAVSEPTNYGFVERIATPDGTGIPGGIGGGARYPGHVIFYVGVPSVEAALAEAEQRPRSASRRTASSSAAVITPASRSRASSAA